MNNFDNEIKKVLKKEVDKPIQYEYAIKNAFSKNKYNKKNNFFHKVALTTGCLIMGCTGVMAVSYIAYEKIWKEPVIVSEDEQNAKVQEKITDQERKEFISEDKAIDIAKTVIQDLGYVEKEIIEACLNRGYDTENGYHYLLRTDDFLIQINPETGELEYFGDNSVLYKDIKCDEVSEEYIKQVANEIYQKLGIIKESDNYQIVSAKRQNMMSGVHINDLWQVSFAKTFNGNYDRSNISTICFAICNGDIVISSITGKKEKNFEDNPVIVTKEDAIEIAKNKEEEFSSLEISDICVNLSIEKMNIFIYCLENNLTNENGELEVNDISRNVWVVKITHNKESKPKDAEIETVKQVYDKKYYIDATTGEIIGGEQAEFFYD